MPLRGSILTGPDYTWSDANAQDFLWSTETKLGLADVDFFDAGVSDRRLVVPTSLDGQTYEIFSWLEANGSSTSGMTMGPVAVAGSPSHGTWHRAWSPGGHPNRGSRSGPILMDGVAAHEWVARTDFFANSASFTLLGARCTLAVLVGCPKPIAMAALRTTTLMSNTGGTVTDIVGTEDFDDGGVLDPVTGEFTAPAGAEAAACNINVRQLSADDTGDVYIQLFKNGSAIRSFVQTNGVRSPGPGTFGLVSCVAGDVFQFKIQSFSGTSRTHQVGCSVEFY